MDVRRRTMALDSSFYYGDEIWTGHRPHHTAGRKCWHDDTSKSKKDVARAFTGWEDDQQINGGKGERTSGPRRFGGIGRHFRMTGCERTINAVAWWADISNDTVDAPSPVSTVAGLMYEFGVRPHVRSMEHWKNRSRTRYRVIRVFRSVTLHFVGKSDTFFYSSTF